MDFTDFDAASWVRDFWQRKPCLIRNPWAAWHNPLDPDGLAGLACEDEVESRLVMRQDNQWSLEHGPFEGQRFAQISDVAWTLLVQAVDHHVPEVADLIAPFRFIPDWRIDDVMVSYAVDGGGVGAHFDQYDVFLIQGLGSRRWEIGAACDEGTTLMPHESLRLLAEFAPTDEWVLEPGDILYVPPGIAHRGTAVGDDCMTYSIGFRAPSHRELVAGFTDHVLADLSDDYRYTDVPPFAHANPGEITVSELARLQAAVTARLTDPGEFALWFGEYATTPKNPDIDWRPDAPVDPEELRAGLMIMRNPASRFAFVREAGDQVRLFVDGRSWLCSGAMTRFAESLCAGGTIVVPGGDPGVIELVVSLLAEGQVAVTD